MMTRSIGRGDRPEGMGHNMRFRDKSDHLDRELRDGAPRADGAFVASLVAELPARPRRRSRTAFASAIAVLVLGTFASFGGVGYAAEGAANAAHAAKQVVTKTSASDEYGVTKAVKPAELKPPTVAVAGVSTQAPTKRTLPFTGLSLVGTVGLGVALFVVGFALRRREHDAS
jgi:hypothetical protein